jgi:hypothetical protein
MLYREIFAVCSEIHTKYTHTLCGQNVEFLNVKPGVHIFTTVFERVISSTRMILAGLMTLWVFCNNYEQTHTLL